MKYTYIGNSQKTVNGRNIFRGDIVESRRAINHAQFIPIDETQRVKKFNPIVIKEKAVKKPRRKK